LELRAARVAQMGYAGLMRGKRVVIAGVGNKVVVFLMRLVPHALLLRMVDQRMQEIRPD
jgi:short-subunit dehydrogenase